jgi:hypothetical protein
VTHPWMQLYTRDWLDCKELRRCSFQARAILIDLMAIAHEGYPYGCLTDKFGALSAQFLAARCVVSAEDLDVALTELECYGRIQRNDAGVLYVPRMAKDADLRKKRAAGGKKGGNPKLVKPKVNLEGKLEDQPRSDSDSVSLSSLRTSKRKEDAPDFEEVNETWKWYQAEYPGDVNAFVELQLFISVMETRQDLADLRANLPVYKATKKWIDGFYPSSENFLSKRIFKIKPKTPVAPAPAKPASPVITQKWKPFDPETLERMNEPY